MAVALATVALVIAIGSYMGYRQMWQQRDMDRFTESVSRIERILDRMELATFVVASDLTVAQRTVDQVAEHLDESQRRADGVISGTPGEAADASAQSGTSDLTE